MIAGVEHGARVSSPRIAVGRDVEAAQRTQLGEIGKSENAPLLLQLSAPAVAHNCRQGAPAQHLFLFLICAHMDARLRSECTHLPKKSPCGQIRVRVLSSRVVRLEPWCNVSVSQYFNRN